MPVVRLLCRKESVDAGRLAGQVAVVVDILFATSTIVHALYEGVETVWPAMSGDEAKSLAARMGSCVLAGEYLAEALPGFASALPLSLSRQSLRGEHLVYSTTNGTVALRGCANAAFVFAGALLNGAALVRHIVSAHPEMSILLVCSGSSGQFNLEDFYGAGHIAAHFARAGYELNEAALAAALFCENRDAYQTLLCSRVGKMMKARSLPHELEYVAQRDLLPVVAQLRGGCLERVAA